MYPITTVFLLTILTVVGTAFGQISPCKDILTTDDQMCFHDEYNQGPPSPTPLLIQESITVFDITEFNKDEKTISLYISLTSFWNDTRVMVRP